MTVCAVVVAGLAWVPAAHAEGSSIATASTVAIGQQETGNTGTVPYGYSPGSCGPETGQYWLLPLNAGEQVTIAWGSSDDYVTGLDIWPAGTADSTIAIGGRAAWASIGENGQQQTEFTATAAGVYPIVFDDSCGQPGPFQFTVTVDSPGSAPPQAPAPAPPPAPTCPSGHTPLPAYPPPTYSVTLSPFAGATLPVGSTATFLARVTKDIFQGQSGRTVSLKTKCGPNIGRSATAKTNKDGYARFTYQDAGGAGTDEIEASLTNASGTAATPASSTITWTAPISCGRLSTFAFVTSLKCLAAAPMVHTILQTGECAEGVASFLAPELKLDKLLDLVRNAKSVKALQRAAGTDGAATGFVYDLYRAYQQPINPNAPAGFRSFKEIVAKLKNLHDSITAAATFLHDIPDLLAAVWHGDTSEIALDVADLTGLKPCVELLADAVN